jgi:signal transduction histidine kinase
VIEHTVAATAVERRIVKVSPSEDERTRRVSRGERLRERLQALERWLRTSPRQVGVLVVLLVVTTLFVQDQVDSHLWLVFTYSFPVALAGYGLGLQGGVATALVVTALLYDHAIGTLGRSDTAFVLATRLSGGLAVTALSALAAATARAREEYLVSRNRLAQLQDDLVAAFAHDVRSPLAAILGYASMLQEESESGSVPPDLVPTLRRIEANALHVESMIAEMLTVEHSQAAPHNTVSRFSAESLLDLLRAEFEPVARSQRREITWAVAAGTPELETDHRKLVSVVRNLVGNALKYAHDGTVSVQIRFDAASGAHRIEVGDEGPGIPRQALPRLFDRFYRVGGARDRDGFGLGLFIVKRMMEMLGGDVAVQSEVGHGTRFLLTVPRLRDEEPLERAAGA